MSTEPEPTSEDPTATVDAGPETPGTADEAGRTADVPVSAAHAGDADAGRPVGEGAGRRRYGGTGGAASA
ncbi:hypothetical protein CJI59_34250, partial [Streptomyces sp. Alain-F2R5]